MFRGRIPSSILCRVFLTFHIGVVSSRLSPLCSLWVSIGVFCFSCISACVFSSADAVVVLVRSSVAGVVLVLRVLCVAVVFPPPTLFCISVVLVWLRPVLPALWHPRCFYIICRETVVFLFCYFCGFCSQLLLEWFVLFSLGLIFPCPLLACISALRRSVMAVNARSARAGLHLRYKKYSGGGGALLLAREAVALPRLSGCVAHNHGSEWRTCSGRSDSPPACWASVGVFPCSGIII